MQCQKHKSPSLIKAIDVFFFELLFEHLYIKLMKIIEIFLKKNK